MENLEPHSRPGEAAVAVTGAHFPNQPSRHGLGETARPLCCEGPGAPGSRTSAGGRAAHRPSRRTHSGSAHLGPLSQQPRQEEQPESERVRRPRLSLCARRFIYKVLREKKRPRPSCACGGGGAQELPLSPRGGGGDPTRPAAASGAGSQRLRLRPDAQGEKKARAIDSGGRGAGELGGREGKGERETRGAGGRGGGGRKGAGGSRGRDGERETRGAGGRGEGGGGRAGKSGGRGSCTRLRRAPRSEATARAGEAGCVGAPGPSRRSLRRAAPLRTPGPQTLGREAVLPGHCRPPPPSPPRSPDPARTRVACGWSRGPGSAVAASAPPTAPPPPGARTPRPGLVPR